MRRADLGALVLGAGLGLLLPQGCAEIRCTNEVLDSYRVTYSGPLEDLIYDGLVAVSDAEVVLTSERVEVRWSIQERHTQARVSRGVFAHLRRAWVRWRVTAR